MNRDVFTIWMLLFLVFIAGSFKAISADADGKTLERPDIKQQASVPMAIDGFPPPMHDAIKLCNEVRFYERDGNYNWKILPFATLSEQSHPHMFHLLKATPCRQRPGHSAFATCKADFVSHGKIISEIGYYANLGWLTEPQQQSGLVPNELRDWLYNLTKKSKY